MEFKCFSSEGLQLDTREELNRFLVEVFHDVLRNEGKYLRALGYGDLSISEMHVIEACILCRAQGCDTAKGIAEMLGITPGSLTASVTVLEKKGYLLRCKDPSDLRRTHITPTGKGLKADSAHRGIHRRMIDEIMEVISPLEADVLLRALRTVAAFFSSERTKEA